MNHFSLATNFIVNSEDREHLEQILQGSSQQNYKKLKDKGVKFFKKSETKNIQRGNLQI